MTKVIKVGKVLCELILCSYVLMMFAVTAPRLVGIESYVVLSGSMEPSIPVGSVIYSAKSDNIDVGDVISFRYSPDYPTITHRIIGKDGDNWITKGDANESVDMVTVSEEMCSGKMILKINLLGYILDYIKIKHIVVVVGITLTLELAGYVDNIETKDKKEKEEKKEKEK